MEKGKWFKNAVIYQIYPRSFCDGNNDGIGDIPGIITKIDYLKNLGINCVWLSPIFDSPMDDNGYDISNYKAIHEMFGTMDDFMEMLEKLHENNIKLILDFVGNHTSDEHPWFQEALKNPNSKYRDYYFFKKGKGKKRPPNNWESFFGGTVWEKVDNDYYYCHIWGKKQPDVNWDNRNVREEFKDILRYWLDLGVDGFRCDVINMISKKDFKSRLKLPMLTGYKAYINGPRLHEYLQELNRDVFSKYDCVTIGETVLTKLKDAIALTDESREELSMIFNFDHVNVDSFLGTRWLLTPFSLRKLKKVFRRWQLGLANVGWNSLFIENHDQRRSVGRFNTSDGKYRTESSKMLATMLYLQKGTPFIYQGQEIGMTNGDFESIDDFRDIETKRMNANIKLPFLRKKLIKISKLISRDNARTPMQWDSSKYAGFSNVKPWIRVNNNKSYINVEKDLEQPNSVFNYFKKLIEYRTNNEIIEKGIYREHKKWSQRIYMYERKYKNKSIFVIASFTKKRVYFNDKKFIGVVPIMTNYKRTVEKRLRPYEVRVYEIENKREN